MREVGAGAGHEGLGRGHLAMLGSTPNPEFRGGVIRRVDDEAVTGFVIDSLNSITAVVLWYTQPGMKAPW